MASPKETEGSVDESGSRLRPARSRFRPVALDLAQIREVAEANGFRTDIPGLDNLDVTLFDGLALRFSNSTDDETIGFSDGTWHFHPPLTYVWADSRHSDFTAEEVLAAISAGDFLVLERYEFGRLADRALIHREDQLDLRYTKLGEEIRLRSAGKPAEAPGAD